MIEVKILDYETRYNDCITWMQEHTELWISAELPSTYEGCTIATNDYNVYISEEKQEYLVEVIRIISMLSQIRSEMTAKGVEPYEPDANHTPEKLESVVGYLSLVETRYINGVDLTREDLVNQEMEKMAKKEKVRRESDL